jgi:hypothetical protein
MKIVFYALFEVTANGLNLMFFVFEIVTFLAGK